MIDSPVYLPPYRAEYCPNSTATEGGGEDGYTAVLPQERSDWKARNERGIITGLNLEQSQVTSQRKKAT